MNFGKSNVDIAFHHKYDTTLFPNLLCSIKIFVETLQRHISIANVATWALVFDCTENENGNLHATFNIDASSVAFAYAAAFAPMKTVFVSPASAEVRSRPTFTLSGGLHNAFVDINI